MAGLVVTIGGNSSQFARELAKANAMAKASAEKMAADINKAQLFGDNTWWNRAVNRNPASRKATSDESEVRQKFLAQAQALARVQEAVKAAQNKREVADEIQKANDIEQARRNIRARELRRERADKIEATKAEQLALASVAARGYGPGRNMYGGHGGAGSPAGVVSEFAVIGHEIMQGRGTGRILGSISILGQRLGWLRKLIKTTADEHIDAAMASGAALAANAKETLSLEAKAVATQADFFATDADKAATLKAAEASRLRTAQLHKETVALVEKAEMEKVNAKVTASPLGKLGLTGLLLAVTAGAVGLMVNKGKQMAQALNPYSSAGVKLDRSAAIDHVAVAWRNISEAVQEANRHYDDANERAKRHLEIIKETYENHSKMLDAQKEGELVSATSAQEKFEIEKKYRAQQIQLDAAQRDAEVQAKRDQAKGLAAETGALIDKAQGITASGVEEEEPHKNRMKMLQERAQKGQEFLDQQHELENKLQSGGTEGLWANIKKSGFETYLGGVNQSSTKAQILEAMNKAKGLAGADVMAGKAAQDAEEPWAAKNALRNKLRGEATTKGEQSQTLKREAVDNAKLNATKTADALKQNDARNNAEQKKLNQIDAVQRARELRSEIAIEQNKLKNGVGYSNDSEKWMVQKDLLEKRSQLAGMIGGGAGTASNNLSQMQKIGAFSAQGGNPLIPINQDMRNSLRQLVALYGNQQRAINNRQGGVSH